MFAAVKRSAMVALVAFGALGAPAPAAAATGSSVTPYSTGAVTCDLNLQTQATQLNLDAPRINLTGFTGTVWTYSYLQYSFDMVNWTNWFPTTPVSMQSTGTVGTTYWSSTGYLINPLGGQWYVRVWDRSEWYDSNGQRIDGQWMLRDYYTGILNSNYSITSWYRSQSSTACALR